MVNTKGRSLEESSAADLAVTNFLTKNFTGQGISEH
jgi:hypothetical protein